MASSTKCVWDGENFEKPNLRPTKTGKKHGALKAVKGAHKAAFIAKQVEGTGDWRDEDDVLGVVQPGTVYSLNKKGRWRAGEVLGSSLGRMQEGGVEVSAVEMESPSPAATAALPGPKDRVKVIHAMCGSGDAMATSPKEGAQFWDRQLAARSEAGQRQPKPLTASKDRAQLRYHIFHPTASEKERTKDARKAVKEASGEVVRGNRNRGKNFPDHLPIDNPFDSEIFSDPKSTQTEMASSDSAWDRRRTLSLGDFLPDELRAGLEGLEDYELPPDADDGVDEDWEILDTPDLDSLDFDKAAAK